MTMHNALMALHIFVGYGTHKALPVPTGPVVPTLPYISNSTLVGTYMKSKVATTVLGMWGIPLVARGNDSGFGVLHFPIGVDTLQPVTMSLGGSTTLFGSSKTLISVDGKGEQCAACLMPFAPLGQNMACNDPCSYPSDYIIAPNTVEVGMTLGDIITGLVSAALAVAVSFGVGKLAGPLSDQVTGALLRSYAMRFGLTEVIERTAELGGREALEAVATRYQTQIAGQFLNGWVGEGAKYLGGKILDAEVNIVAHLCGEEQSQDQGSLYDGYGNMAAAGLGQEQTPASDSRVYGADGVEQGPEGGWI
jgi:hypothetical protein